MPLFNYKCDEGHITRKILDKEIPKIQCKTCTKDAFREITTPSFAMKEFRDNGFTARRVDAYTDIKELLKERDDATKPKKDES